MKLTFWKGKNNSKSIHIYSQFYSKDVIIPIGSDCHSAYILNALNLRNQSLIFDWLFTNSKYGIEYVNINLKNNFSQFLDSLVLNHRNHIISKNFPNTEFFHEKKLIESEKDRDKLRNRARRFQNMIEKNRCSFLYVINPEHFESEYDIENFVNSIQELNSITNEKHFIKIFIKCKQHITDFTLIDSLVYNCNKIKNVNTQKYFLDTQKYGQWGDSRDFFPLIKKLGIHIRRSLVPKIYIK